MKNRLEKTLQIGRVDENRHWNSTASIFLRKNGRQEESAKLNVHTQRSSNWRSRVRETGALSSLFFTGKLNSTLDCSFLSPRDKDLSRIHPQIQSAPVVSWIVGNRDLRRGQIRTTGPIPVDKGKHGGSLGESRLDSSILTSLRPQCGWIQS